MRLFLILINGPANNKNNSQTLPSEADIWNTKRSIIVPSNSRNILYFFKSIKQLAIFSRCVRIEQPSCACAVTHGTDFIQNFYTYTYTIRETQNDPLQGINIVSKSQLYVKNKSIDYK